MPSGVEYDLSKVSEVAQKEFVITQPVIEGNPLKIKFPIWYRAATLELIKSQTSSRKKSTKTAI